MGVPRGCRAAFSLHLLIISSYTHTHTMSIVSMQYWSIVQNHRRNHTVSIVALEGEIVESHRTVSQLSLYSMCSILPGEQEGRSPTAYNSKSIELRYTDLLLLHFLDMWVYVLSKGRLQYFFHFLDIAPTFHTPAHPLPTLTCTPSQHRHRRPCAWTTS